jgi:hypothetical protein
VSTDTTKHSHPVWSDSTKVSTDTTKHGHPAWSDSTKVKPDTTTIPTDTTSSDTTKRTVSSSGINDVESSQTVVKVFGLSQNYPNPFNPSTVIKFSLPDKMNAKLTVYDMQGREVAQLVNTELEAGQHSVQFNASGLASGIYFYTLSAKNMSATHKLLLLK